MPLTAVTYLNIILFGELSMKTIFNSFESNKYFWKNFNFQLFWVI